MNQEPESIASVRKRIVICADGTWDTPRIPAHDGVTSTNVWSMFRMVRPLAKDSLPQLAYYHAGVGTRGVVDRILGGAFGIGLNANIEACYRFLSTIYRPGDELFLFGFSRGAYTVRSLAGLIRNCGILDTGKARAGETLDGRIRRAFALYRDRDDASSPTAQRSFEFRLANSYPDFRITCIGVWDTVGALGIPVGGAARRFRRWSFHDVTLSSWVDYAFHAIAIDERRGAFEPTLWLQQQSGVDSGQVLEQVWFAGVHADIGGGYTANERGLANLTLRWMVDRVTNRCGLDLDAAQLGALAGSEVRHDSMSWWYRQFRPCNRAIDAGVVASGARNPGRRTRETLSPTAESAYAMPADHRGTHRDPPSWPLNVTDYLQRMAAARRQHVI